MSLAKAATSSQAVARVEDDILDFISMVPFRASWKTGTTVYRSVNNFPDDWRMERDLSLANYGRVYLYRHLPSDTVMAVKIMGNDAQHTHGTLKIHKGIDDGVVERLLKNEQSEHMVTEIGASYYLTYQCEDYQGKQYVLPMLGVWMDERYVHFATEACDNELFNVIKNASLEESKTAEEVEFAKKIWAFQLFSAVSYIHRNNVAHRDISLENILLHQDGNVRLMDFGMAVPANVSCSGRVGKQIYRPPEMYRRQPYCPRASDIFMCGMVLFIMLTGKPIFSAAVPQDPAYTFIARNGIEALLTHWQIDYTAPFTIVTRCIRHNPQDRASVDEILLDPWFDPVRNLPVPAT